jgi:hypothetical protein
MRCEPRVQALSKLVSYHLSHLISHISFLTSHFSLLLSLVSRSRYSLSVAIKLCAKCRRPFLAAKERCPHCPEPYTWDQESFANLGCLVATILPLVVLLLFWFFLFLGVFLR